jgi:PAS domain-containing protein
MGISERSYAATGTFRVFAVLTDEAALERLERVFAVAPDRELVGVAADPTTAFAAIMAADASSVYIDVDEPGADELITQLRQDWIGYMRTFTLDAKQTVARGGPVVEFEELATVLEGIYELKLEQGVAWLSLACQNLILDSLYQRSMDEGFLIVSYDGEVIFYGPRAARFGGLTYPPPAGLTEADVSNVIGRAHRREPVKSDDGRVLAERFWIRAPHV